MIKCQDTAATITVCVATNQWGIQVLGNVVPSLMIRIIDGRQIFHLSAEASYGVPVEKRALLWRENQIGVRVLSFLVESCLFFLTFLVSVTIPS